MQTEEFVHAGCGLTTLQEVQASLAASLAATDEANARAAAAEQRIAAAEVERAAAAEQRAAMVQATLEADKAEVWRQLLKLGHEAAGTGAPEPKPQRDTCNMCWGTGVCDYDDSVCQTCLGSGWQPE